MNGADMVSDAGRVHETVVEPIPPRFWWLKRIIAGAGLVLIALLCLRWWWGWEAHRRLQAEIDKYIAAGEPVYPEDFDPEPVPDDHNAARFLLDAEKALNLTPEQTELIHDVLSDSTKLHEHLDEVAKIVAANERALELVRKARGLPGADWGVRIRSPAINTMLPSLSGQRHLAKLLAATTNYQHATGNDAAAIETLRDWLAQARAVDAQPTLIPHLVAIACETLVAQSVERLAPTLKVQRTLSSSNDTSRAAPRPQVVALIVSLLDDDVARNAFTHATLSERMLQLDIVEIVLRGDAGLSAIVRFPGVTPAPLWQGVAAYPLKPIMELDALATMRHCTRYAEAAGKPNWPAAVAASPPEPDGRSAFESLIHPLTSTMLPSLSRAVVLHYRMLAWTRMAGIALAIRLYQIDHGHRPETLAHLVPEYLPEVPLDPFADDGRTIGYRPDAEPPILYSIGTDGADDGGAFTFRRSGGIDWDKLDIPFFLDGNRPRSED